MPSLLNVLRAGCLDDVPMELVNTPPLESAHCVVEHTRTHARTVAQDVGGEASGPLDEIEFWRGRSIDLSGIRTQLDDPAVAAIVSVLEFASSSYLAPFLDLRNLIHRWADGCLHLCASSCICNVYRAACLDVCYLIHWGQAVGEGTFRRSCCGRRNLSDPSPLNLICSGQGVGRSGGHSRVPATHRGALSGPGGSPPAAGPVLLLPNPSLCHLTFAHHREAVAAEDNLKFLLCLEEPCQGLVAAHPQEIPALLPPILNCIRMVWNISRFYNTPERVTVLLRKLSNAIIVRCTAVISLEDVFSGEVRSGQPHCPAQILAVNAHKKIGPDSLHVPQTLGFYCNGCNFLIRALHRGVMLSSNRMPCGQSQPTCMQLSSSLGIISSFVNTALLHPCMPLLTSLSTNWFIPTPTYPRSHAHIHIRTRVDDVMETLWQSIQA
eukprot:scaffold93080_cov19-Tisochrysis_lutea.AAC.3